MIAQQFGHGSLKNVPEIPESPEEFLTLGAKLLRVAAAFDNLRMRGVDNKEAVLQLRYRSDFDQKLVACLSDMKPYDSKMELRKLPISSVTVGAILQQDVRNNAGLLIIAKGQEVTRPLLSRLEHFSRARLIDNGSWRWFRSGLRSCTRLPRTPLDGSITHERGLLVGESP